MDELTAELLRYQSTYRTASHLLEREDFTVPERPPEVEARWREQFDRENARALAVDARSPHVTRAVSEVVKGAREFGGR